MRNSIKLKSKFLSLIFSLTILANSQNIRNYHLLKVGLHFDSKVSGGKYTMAELAGFANSYGLDAAIITDHDNMKVTYGISPFTKFLKFSIQENSIANYGVEKYLQEILQTNQVYSNIVFIPGVEAVPYYFWQGSPLYSNLILKNWHTHLLVFGLPNVEAYKQLPSLANRGLGYQKPEGELMQYIAKHFSYFSLIALYLILFLISIFSIIRRSRRRRDIAHITHRRHRYHFSWKALLFTLLFGYILYSEYPFLPLKYDQYHGNPGSGPFQELINYVNANQGMIFWAHPEVAHTEMRPLKIPLLKQTIKIETEAYPKMITETKDYTGFCIFWEGMKTVGLPGGLWDIVLDEYCTGIRKKPVWAIGELDFEESNELTEVSATNTFVFTTEKSQNAILEAIRSGRMYTTRNHFGDHVILEDFSVYDPHTNRSAFIGETLLMPRPPVGIHVKIRSLEVNPRPTTVFLYRNTELIKTFPLQNQVDDYYLDQEPFTNSMNYYRILVGSRDFQSLATNPVFVKRY